MLGRTKTALLIAAATLPIAAGGTGQPASAPASQAPARARAATLEDLATKLVDRFVDPAAGARYAAMLRANAAAGKYDALTDDAAFAKQVTSDLQAVAFDGHLKLLAGEPSGGIAAQGGHTDSKTIEAKARLTKDVAYIRFGNFFGDPAAIAEAKQFLLDNKDAKTLIFDVRTHLGGGLAEMDAIFPLIFAEPTVLVAMDTRTAVDSADGDASEYRLRRIAAPDSVVRREHFVEPAAGGAPLGHAKIYVLSSGRTGSAGEHFVLSMKRTHRATVIGETTYGAGNYGGFEPIAGGFRAFIPVGRTFDPDTNKGWDYVGVAPNIAVPAAQALVDALVRSGVPKAEAEKMSAQYGPSADQVSSQRKAPASVLGI